MTIFDDDTRLTSLRDGTHEITFNRNWWLVAGPNGGLLAAQLAAAALETVNDRPIRTMTMHFVAPAREGTATIHTVVERLGRGVAFLRQRMEQDGRLLATAIVAMAGPRDVGAAWNEIERPAVAAPDQCPALHSDEAPVSLRARWETRWTAGVTERPSSIVEPGEIAVGGWTRLAEEQPLDQRVLAAMSDSWMPPLMLHGMRNHSAPTLELTIHFRADLADVDTSPGGWCHTLFSSPVGADGFVDESGEIWSPDGRLVLQCRQLSLMIPMPDLEPGEGRPDFRWTVPDAQP